MAGHTMPWYEQLFGELYVRFWLGGSDSPMIPAERTAGEVEFVAERLSLQPGMRVLDLCCGHGRHAIALAQRGLRVCGVDLSALHLEMARQAAARAGVEVDWVNADMRALPAHLTGQFDAVINMFTAFGYFQSDDEDQQVLAEVARVLRAGGRFLIDYINLGWLLRNYTPRDFQERDGRILLRERSFNPATGRNLERLTEVDTDGTRETLELDMRCYAPSELLRMIRAAGLTVTGTWGDFAGAPLTFETLRVIVAAEKG